METIIAVIDGNHVTYQRYEGDITRDIENAIDLSEGMLDGATVAREDFRHVYEVPFDD